MLSVLSGKLAAVSAFIWQGSPTKLSSVVARQMSRYVEAYIKRHWSFAINGLKNRLRLVVVRGSQDPFYEMKEERCLVPVILKPWMMKMMKIFLDCRNGFHMFIMEYKS